MYLKVLLFLLLLPSVNAYYLNTSQGSVSIYITEGNYGDNQTSLSITNQPIQYFEVENGTVEFSIYRRTIYDVEDRQLGGITGELGKVKEFIFNIWFFIILMSVFVVLSGGWYLKKKKKGINRRITEYN